MKQLNTLTTASEYIKYYSKKLPEIARAKNLKISRAGIIGFFIHLLGYTQSDIKNYYDGMFREAFLATADKFENITMHSGIFGYMPAFATPATIYGDFDIDINSLINIYGESFKIVIQKLEFKVNDINFVLDSKYEITLNSAKITNSVGRTYNVPFSFSNPAIPIVDCKQYQIQTFTFRTSNYPFLSFYNQSFDLQYDGEIWEIDVRVKTENSEEYEEYEVYTVKYTTNNETKALFIQFLDNKQILIECGSGRYGKHIPNAEISINVKITKGQGGNIHATSIFPSNIELNIFTDSDNKTSSNSTYFLGNIYYADGGKNIYTSNELRQKSIEHIQTREYMMTKTDFDNIISQEIEDYFLMFKKTHVVENHFYVFYPLKNNYQNFIPAKSISIQHSDFNPDNLCERYRPIFIDDDGIEYISPFLYVCDANLRQYNAYVVHEVIGFYFETIKFHKKDEYPTPLPLSLNLEFIESTFETKFVINSYQDIGSIGAKYVFFITVEQLDIDHMCMSNVSDTSFEIQYDEIIYDPVTVKIEVQNEETAELIFTYISYNVSLVDDISDLLTLKTWDGDVDTSTASINKFYDDSWVLHIPVVKNNIFCNDSDYYINYIINFLTKLAENKNRMLSDDIQMRFINTDRIKGLDNLTNSHTDDYLLTSISLQQYKFNMVFPLNLEIILSSKNNYIVENNIDTNQDIEDLNLQLATKLYEEYTGIDFVFYKTQIINIVHQFKWIKYCEIRVFDSSDTPVELPDGDLELLNQRDILNSLDKKQGVLFCPVYVWWNLDNIQISLVYG